MAIILIWSIFKFLTPILINGFYVANSYITLKDLTDTGKFKE